jgi:hypothetical protein
VSRLVGSEMCIRDRLSDDDFSTFATKIKFSKHFNVIIQAQVAALNRESRRRGLI